MGKDLQPRAEGVRQTKRYSVDCCNRCMKRTDICHAVCKEYYLDVLATRILAADGKSARDVKAVEDRHRSRSAQIKAGYAKRGANGR